MPSQSARSRCWCTGHPVWLDSARNRQVFVARPFTPRAGVQGGTLEARELHRQNGLAGCAARAAIHNGVGRVNACLQKVCTQGRSTFKTPVTADVELKGAVDRTRNMPCTFVKQFVVACITVSRSCIEQHTMGVLGCTRHLWGVHITHQGMPGVKEGWLFVKGLLRERSTSTDQACICPSNTATWRCPNQRASHHNRAANTPSLSSYATIWLLLCTPQCPKRCANISRCGSGLRPRKRPWGETVGPERSSLRSAYWACGMWPSSYIFLPAPRSASLKRQSKSTKSLPAGMSEASCPGDIKVVNMLSQSRWSSKSY
jgi:hypothetical protein